MERGSRADDDLRHVLLRRHAAGNGDEERIVTSEGSKRCAVVGHVNKTEEIRYQKTRLIGTNESQDHLFGPLIQCVERKREEKDELHVRLNDEARMSNDERSRNAQMTKPARILAFGLGH